MIWCKLPILNRLKTPIDLGKNFVDGKRIFGDNKTYKGLVGYVFFEYFNRNMLRSFMPKS